MPKGKEKESTARIKGFMHIMDSMTMKEMDDPTGKLMNTSRAWRIARGSGRPIADVIHLVEEHRRIGRIVAKMKAMMPKKGPKDMNAMAKNMDPNVMAKMLDPRVLQQMGGAEGLKQMMKQMQGMGLGGGGGAGGAGGMPNLGGMQEMMEKMMGGMMGGGAGGGGGGGPPSKKK
jgi:signal recognition particle subunit SRP54